MPYRPPSNLRNEDFLQAVKMIWALFRSSSGILRSSLVSQGLCVCRRQILILERLLYSTNFWRYFTAGPWPSLDNVSNDNHWLSIFRPLWIVALLAWTNENTSLPRCLARSKMHGHFVRLCSVSSAASHSQLPFPRATSVGSCLHKNWWFGGIYLSSPVLS